MRLSALRNRVLLALSRNLPYSAGGSIAAAGVTFDTLPSTVQFCTRDGINLELDLSDVQPREIFLYGYTEPSSVRWFKKLVKPGMTVVDVGANLGQYSLLASRLVGRAGAVHAFEPEPDNRRRLERNLSLNPALRERVRVNALGLGDRKEVAALYSGPKGYLGMASMVRRVLPDARVTRVPLTTLDEYVEENRLGGVDFVKLDVEGFELKVLQGGRGTLTGSRPMGILCELNALTLPHAGTSPEEIVRYLGDFSFRPFSPRTFPLPMTSMGKYPPDMVDNVVFLRG